MLLLGGSLDPKLSQVTQGDSVVILFHCGLLFDGVLIQELDFFGLRDGDVSIFEGNAREKQCSASVDLFNLLFDDI